MLTKEQKEQAKTLFRFIVVMNNTKYLNQIIQMMVYPLVDAEGKSYKTSLEEHLYNFEGGFNIYIDEYLVRLKEGAKLHKQPELMQLHDDIKEVADKIKHIIIDESIGEKYLNSDNPKQTLAQFIFDCDYDDCYIKEQELIKRIKRKYCIEKEKNEC